MNRSQENWPDVQLSLSTATPSLGGAPPKLATLKIGYEVSRDIRYISTYSKPQYLAAAGFMDECSSLRRSKSFGLTKMKARSTLSSSALGEEKEEEQSSPTINVLAAQTEASMSSTSFAIPRRSTIDADVSSLFSCNLLISKNYFYIGQTT